MVHDRRSALSSYVSGLLSVGRTVFTAEEAQQALGVGHGAFLDAAERLQRRGALLSPRRGFYVAVPPQYGSWGGPPPAWYVDALMRHEGHAYYVGLLKAAELHGATHQAVMEFQVVSNRRLPKIRAGRNLIVFYFRKNIEAVAAGTEGRKTDTGTMRISSAALTALDLLRYPQAAGGIDTVATVLLGSRSEDRSRATHRALGVGENGRWCSALGHLLEHLGHDALTGSMLESLRARGSLPWTELDRQEAWDPDFAPEPQQRDPAMAGHRPARAGARRMIPAQDIVAWGTLVPWTEVRQVEQDLIISRALVEIFSDPVLREALRFRGGTALNKLHFPAPLRYSEDIDLVRTSHGPIGPVLDRLRVVLEPWLGRARFEQSRVAPKFRFRGEAEDGGPPIRLKIEINTREIESFDAPTALPLDVVNPWFSGSAAVSTFSREEMLATKLRALLQRDRGRDLYDLAHALEVFERLEIDRIVEVLG